ncbi:MAG: alpha/beta hydrolase [Bacteroidales bacterium]
MKKLLFFLLMLMSGIIPVLSQNEDIKGQIIEYLQFKSDHITPRNISVWLPENYNHEKKYAVIYMHDGQMLFDHKTTWNNQEWKVDETIDRLLKENLIKDCIVVGIWNIENDRFYDYFPQKTWNYIPDNKKTALLPDIDHARLNADNYLKFITSELKPFIDITYSTYQDKNNTFLLGSSMGGLISLYGLCEYPDIFGGAACLSVHSPMVTSKLLTMELSEIIAPAFCLYLQTNLPETNSCHIYMDLGNQTLDALYIPFQNNINDVFWKKGWKLPYWTTNYYPGTAHSEKDWADRLATPLLFLLQTQPSK